ncbi:LysR family transcriptional regulator [Maritimibacter alkaliphilus]|uniref:LysR family transcriptional regulator n=1 Tax=Maritimibacter alkaliphilus TaxID=404236 RepID=UPI001C97D005|nr:LysR family transcriptional regulator [Maritimibacter alkaliphilus]MBY6091521.1 LysR family transcriptional regulator [Maritimibacter alkaliphilus]
MIDLSDLRFFGAIADAPSLAAAARALGITPPAVSQRLAQIEARLGLRLVDRGGGRLSLTAEGELLARRGAALLDAAGALSEDLALRRGALTGPLRVIAPFGYGRIHIAPLLADFMEAHPDVAPELTLAEDPRGAIRGSSWDVLIHVGRLPDLDMTQRFLAPNRRLLCAAPLYLEAAGRPRRPADLARHRCGVVREDQADVTLWQLSSAEARQGVRITPAFACNDGEVVRDWALRGLGIVERSEWSVAQDIATGRLEQVLPGWQLPNADIVALLNPRSGRAVRVESFLTHLVTRLSRGAA